MTVAELIQELLKLDGDIEVWVDTEYGLFPTEMVYETHNTVIIRYADDTNKGIEQ